MTNGEMIKSIFPSAEIDIGNGGNDIWIAIDCWTIFKKEWWNAEYKEPTTKNDLGVDCVARHDVERFIEGFINEYTPEEELEFINLELDGLKHLPPATPQEPKPMVEIDLYSVIKQKYIEREVLDKIRAEIKKWYWQADKQALAKDPCVVDAMIDLFIRTIDKYKAEVEPQESEVEDGNDKT